MISCEVFCDSISAHLEQIYTGLVQLHRKGVIRLKQRICKAPATWLGVRVLLDGRISVYYDTYDRAAINTDVLKDVDFYFKRSFAEEHRQTAGNIYPLGLNYRIFSKGIDWFRMVRELSLGTSWARARRVIRQIGMGNYPSVAHLEALPNFAQPGRVLLMTKAWKPGTVQDPDASTEALNLMRAQCVRLLRRELGPLFFGGLAPNDFARKYFSDAVLPDKRAFALRNYFARLRQFPICVVTNGLGDSNGWRFGEYVALSKAIVAERPVFRVPGDFAEGSNYLEFTTPEECVEATVRLMHDEALRHRLSVSNFRYYQAYLRPDSLVLNTLAIALSRAAVSPGASPGPCLEPGAAG